MSLYNDMSIYLPGIQTYLWLVTIQRID